MRKLTRGQILALLEVINFAQATGQYQPSPILLRAKEKLEIALHSSRADRFLQPVEHIEVIK